MNDVKLKKSVKKFKQFQNREPKQLRTVKIDTSTPLIEIGRVPVITYESEKEGKKQFYFHETDEMPTLFAHPDGKFFIMLGGSIKINDWLEG